MKGDAPDAPEFAELYTLRERVRLVLIGLAIAGAVLVPFHIWLLPMLEDFAAHVSCRRVAGVEGPTVLFYGIFVGMPLAIAAALALVCIPHGLRVLREGQFPLKGQKVTRPTRIRRGLTARRWAYGSMAVPAVFIAIAVWGSFQVPKIVEEISRQHRPCTEAASPG
jgi:hypothetical protein